MQIQKKIKKEKNKRTRPTSISCEFGILSRKKKQSPDPISDRQKKKRGLTGQLPETQKQTHHTSLVMTAGFSCSTKWHQASAASGHCSGSTRAHTSRASAVLTTLRLGSSCATRATLTHTHTHRRTHTRTCTLEHPHSNTHHLNTHLNDCTTERLHTKKHSR